MQENVIDYQFIPKLNEGISIHEFDSSYDKKYIIIFENKYYMVSKMFVNILNLIDGEKNIDEIYFDIINNLKYSISKDDFIIFFIKNIYEKRLLHGCESIQKKSINQSFIFYKKIFDKNNIRKITSLTKYLINKYFFVITLIFTLISQIFFINFKNIKLLNIEALDFLIILSLLTMSTIFHEFGHASASRFYNSDCNEIGFGLYIYFFVFYSDVTNVWILKRRQRAVVDISGIYFQLIFMNFITIIYLFSGYELLERFIFISDLVIFYNLNPFLKMDGYWFVSDIFGVPNLIHYTRNMIKTFFVKNKSYKKIYYGIDKGSKIKYFLFLYVVLSNIFFCFFLLNIIRIIYFYYLTEFPLLINNYIQKILLTVNNNIINCIYYIILLIIQVFILITFLLFIYNTLLRLIKWLINNKKGNARAGGR